MDAERWGRIRALADRVADMPAPERRSAVDRECAGDEALRADVLALVDADHVPRDFLEPMDAELAGSVLAQVVAEEPLGDVVGPYRLTDVVGGGGMGTVYRAHRTDGQFDQHVAVKLCHAAAVPGSGRRRFTRELQALARLQHPNIARLLDGGVTAAGTTYIVMELINGAPIDTYCRAARLDVRTRLALFRDVCAAVQFAHEQLVVHRDLKPANILVTNDRQVKLVDFGVARLLDEAGATGPDEATGTEFRALTPQYASPEQVRDQPVTAAGEVYALGVVLYELLAGCRPYALDGLARAEMERVICEEDPPAPSVAVEPAGPDADQPPDRHATHRETLSPSEARAQRRELVGDLDTIVLKAMHKEATRRYTSVRDLRADIGRYLAGFPVRAQRDTLAYRARKFVGRNLAAVLALGAVTLSLFVGVIGIFAGLRRAQDAAALAAAESVRANRAAHQANQIADVLQDILMSADPLESGGVDLTLREVLLEAERRIDDEHADQPDVQAVLHRVVGSAYRRLGLFVDAEPHLRAAVAYHADRAEPTDVREHAAARQALARLLSANGAPGEAETHLRRALALRRALPDGSDTETADVLVALASACRRCQPDDAEAYVREALEIRRRVLGAQHPRVADAITWLAEAHLQRAQYAAAEAEIDTALSIRRTAYGNINARVAESLHQWARLHTAQNAVAQAEAKYVELMEIYAALTPRERIRMLQPVMDWAEHLGAQGRAAEAEAVFADALATTRTVLPPGHYIHLAVTFRYSSFLSHQERYAEAEPLLLDVYQGVCKLIGPDHRSAQSLRERLVALYARWGKPERAAALERAKEPLSE